MKKPSFKPIAMRCNQEQFYAVKYKLDKYNLQIKHIYEDWDTNCYLKNNGAQNPDIPFITNITDSWKSDLNRTVYETWNEKIFLESCGIEVEEPKEETFVISKTRIEYLQELGISKTMLEDWFPSAFVEDKKELVVESDKLKESIWYKSLDFPKWMLCVTNVSFKEKRVKGYGFGSDGNWMGNAQNDSWEFNEFDRCVEMTPEEAKETLTKEAVKRYESKCLEPLNRHMFDRDDEPKDCIHLFDSNSLSICKEEIWMDYGKYCAIIFKEGKWAEIIQLSQNPKQNKN